MSKPYESFSYSTSMKQSTAIRVEEQKEDDLHNQFDEDNDIVSNEAFDDL